MNSGKIPGKKINKFKYYYKIEKKVGEGGTLETLVEASENPYNCIPCIPIHQNRFSNEANGYSDASGLIRLCGVYHQVFESMIDTNIYNGKPTMVFSGLANADKFVESTYGEINPETGDISSFGNYELFGSYYLEGNANVNYLQVGNSYIDGAKEILRLLFYIFVQIGEVPEWAYGAHIDGTWASTKMQSTPLIQKIESKRLDINDAMMKLNMVVAKILEVNNGKKYSTYRTSLEWSEPLPEDRDYILSCIDKIIPLDIITNEKILELLDIVEDPKAEIAKHEKAKKKKEIQQNKMNENDIVNKLMKLKGSNSENNSDENDKVNGTEDEVNDENNEENSDNVTPDNKNKKFMKKAKVKAGGEMKDDIDDVLSALIGPNYMKELGLDD